MATRIVAPGGAPTHPQPAGSTQREHPAPAAAILYEHSDGRRAVALTPVHADFATDDPDWHRAGPVDILRLGHQDASAERYTFEQYQIILETIAGRAATLNNVLLLLQSNQDARQGSVLTDAAQHLAEDIGVIADGANGFVVHRSAEDWHYGPNFAHAGKAGAA